MNVAHERGREGFVSCDEPATVWYKHNDDICSYCPRHDYECGERVQPCGSLGRICELASQDGVDQRAVENFLGTLEGMTEDEATANLVQDAKSFRWDTLTVRVIQQGIREHFHGR